MDKVGTCSCEGILECKDMEKDGVCKAESTVCSPTWCVCDWKQKTSTKSKLRTPIIEPGKLAPKDDTSSPTFKTIAPKSGTIAPTN